ncbi:transcription antitermination factor NusB [Bifidobacterium xylocopae]|uniref:Transcription antitermination protein NusB n=1 Tax=Bifidobacterium xylocopae TaxID=2493119 RepID=A0A366KFA6_9BIFI|nr:transcription antitermination factor NusB [Bifidobacterium xylocopae]RBP99922.1 transcription antitermination factor NusB [Bifidobacterium xylocopae]
MARSTARKRALNTLYEADEKGQDIESLLSERIAQPGAQTPLPDYAIQIVRGVADHLGDINSLLDEHSTSWPVRRMAVIDRNIMRIAVWEMLYNPEVPGKVAIDEALSLAKTLSEADSPSFIHGLLSAVERDRQAVEEDASHARERADEAARIAALAEAEAAKAESDGGFDTSDDSGETSRSDGARTEDGVLPRPGTEIKDAVEGVTLDDLSLDIPPQLG